MAKKVVKKKARKVTKRASKARGPKLSDWVLEQRNQDGYNPNPEGLTTAERLGGGPCREGVAAFDFLEGLEAKGWSVAKICEFAREENPVWYETYILEESCLDYYSSNREDNINYLREAAGELESGLDNAAEYVDNTEEDISAKVRTTIETEVKRLRARAEEIENEPALPLVRVVGKKGSLQLEVVE